MSNGTSSSTMSIPRRLLCLLFISGLAICATAQSADTPDPRELIRAAMQHWRGVTSYAEMTITIHRTDWQRSFSMQVWTEGDKQSLVRVTEARRDAGNGSLGQESYRYP